MPQVDSIRPLEVSPLGGTETLTVVNRGSESVFYGEDAQVSATKKTGTLASGENLSITRQTWFIAKARPSILDVRQANSVKTLTETEGLLDYHLHASNPTFAGGVSAARTAAQNAAAMVAIGAVIEARGQSAIVELPAGVIKMNPVAWGPSFPGVHLYGQGREDTILSSPEGEQILKITGSFLATGYSFDHLAIRCEVDAPYSQGLLELVECRELETRGDFFIKMTGTGVGLRLNASYAGPIKGSTRCGKYAIPIEHVTTITQGVDTITHDALDIGGPIGVVIRGGLPTMTPSLANFSGFSFRRCKVVDIETEGPGPIESYLTAEAKVGDTTIKVRLPEVESILATEAKKGDTTIKLKAGEGAVYAARDFLKIGTGEKTDFTEVMSIEGDVLTLDKPIHWAHVAETTVGRTKFEANACITIDSGRSIEVAKVTLVTPEGGKVQTITLSKPLLYKHESGVQVTGNGFGIAVGDMQTLSVEGMQIEGVPTGIIAGNKENENRGRGWEIKGIWSNAYDAIRLTGSLYACRIGPLYLSGRYGRCVVLRIPQTNKASPSEMIVLAGPFGSPSFEGVTTVVGELTAVAGGEPPRIAYQAEPRAPIAAVTNPGAFKKGAQGFETEAEAKAVIEKLEALTTAVTSLRAMAKAWGQVS
jgi:hypothetical protein